MAWMTTVAAVLALVGAGAPAAAQSQQQVPTNVQQDLQKLHAGNQAEIQTARTALQRGQSQAVKDLATMLERDHQQIDAQLQHMSQQMGVDLQGKAYHSELNRLQTTANGDLSGTHGEAFDRAYARLMVEDHKNDVNNNLPHFIKDARNANLPQIAAMLDEVDATLKGHLAAAQRTQAHEQQQAGSGTTGTGQYGTGAAGAGAEPPRTGSSMGTGATPAQPGR